MTAPNSISATTYRCFISYRHADNHTEGRRWATWLHQRLEKYPVPPSLVGTTNLRGKPVPRSIFPVFRDEDELPADADLSTPILRALDHSLGMVVICSPRARASRFVDDEVRLYKRATRGERILGLIIAGTPDTSEEAEDTCFPRAYLRRTDQAGQVLPEAELPLNLVDLRTHDGQEGWTDEEHHQAALAAAETDETEADVAVEGFTKHLEEQFLMVVAHVLEVPAATLAEHHHRHQAELGRARLRSRLIWGSALLLLALAAWQGVRLSMEKGAAAGAAAQAADAQSRLALERKAQLEEEERRTKAAQAASDYAQALAQQSLPSSSVQLIEEKIRSAAGLGHAPAQVALGQRLQGRPGGAGEAIDWFTKAAQQGHAPAMEALGLAYRDGQGVAADRALAENWLRQAADLKLGSAQFELGRLLKQGGVAEAARWLELAAKDGHPGSQFELGTLLLAANGAPEMTAGRRWLEAAAKQGLAEAQRELGLSLARGQGGPVDILTALRWLQAAEGKGDQAAAQELARLFKEETSLPKNRAEALQWHLARAASGNPVSQNIVGLAYRDGLDAPVDLHKAEDFLEKAATAGLPEAQYHLGELFAKGLTRRHRRALEFQWKERAARQGHLQAMHDIAQLYFSGFKPAITDPQDTEWVRQAGLGTAAGEPAGMEWLTKAAEGGHVRASLDLGRRLLAKPAADKVAALGWIRKAAEQGETLGQLTLGIALRDGHGQKPDRAEAIRWLGLAATKGQTEAEFALAMLLLESATGAENTKGAGWLRKAAEHGHVPAQLQLGEILLSGVGVKSDPQEAYQWLLIATANPQGLSREQRSAATRRLNLVAERLTPAQRLAAQQAATLFSPAAPAR